MNPKRKLPKKVIEKLKRLHNADTAQSPGDRTPAGISTVAYPPYPRTKIAYYNIIQDQINSSHTRGYYAGRQEAINQERDSLFNRTVDALIKVSIALAERKH